MARIEALELQYTDLEWYGVDRQGRIAVFLSSGCANVPVFVCESKERTDALIAYFENVGNCCQASLCDDLPEGSAAMAREMAGRGVYCFDAVEGQRHYHKLGSPEVERSVDELPNHIRDLLQHNRMDVDDFREETTIHVVHAYP